MRKIRVFDNGEKYADRYTVQIESSVFTMSSDATQPNGVNMYIGEIDELVLSGKEIRITDLPLKTLVAIVRRLQDN